MSEPCFGLNENKNNEIRTSLCVTTDRWTVFLTHCASPMAGSGKTFFFYVQVDDFFSCTFSWAENNVHFDTEAQHVIANIKLQP